MGYRTIVSSYEKLYLDCGPSAKWCAPYKSWSLIYGYDPTEGLSATEANLVLGATACLWTESIKRDILDPGSAWRFGSDLSECHNALSKL